MNTKKTTETFASAAQTLKVRALQGEEIPKGELTAILTAAAQNNIAAPEVVAVIADLLDTLSKANTSTPICSIH